MRTNGSTNGGLTTTATTSPVKSSPLLSTSPAGVTPRSAQPTTSSTSSSFPRVVYGSGTIARLPTELARMCISSPLIVSSPSRVGLARCIQASIPNLDSHILDSAIANVPSHVVDDAVSRISGRDAVISVGGGSAVGLARAVGIRKGIPHICIPTTYSGSEMTPLYGDVTPGSKSNAHIALQDSKILPAVIIYDEDLTKSPPRRFSVPSSTGSAAPSCDFSSSLSPKDDTAQWSYIQLPGV